MKGEKDGIKRGSEVLKVGWLDVEREVGMIEGDSCGMSGGTWLRGKIEGVTERRSK